MPWSEESIKAAREDAVALARRAVEMKAEKVAVLDVSLTSDMCSHMVIATASSRRHAQSVAEDLARLAKSRRMHKIGMEGQQEGKWVLLDLTDVVVHVFLAEVREFYNLEMLWEDARPVEV